MPCWRRHGQEEKKNVGGGGGGGGAGGPGPVAGRAAKHGLSLRDRLVGYLPRYAGLASRFAPLANLRNSSALLRSLFETFTGISAQRALPAFRRDVFAPGAENFGPIDGREVVLFADT